jgi:3-deoxy-D-manno-octulosonic-acid transferase
VFPLYLLLQGGSLVSSKIRRGRRGRKKLFDDLEKFCKSIDRSKPLIWVHSSSLGEFEQGKPVIEKLKKERDVTIIVSFFSPSGYENSKKYPHADYVTYIPFDSPGKASRFVTLLKPDLHILMRYDIWPHHINQLYKRNIPVLLVDATMRADSPRRNMLLRGFHRGLFCRMKKIITVSQSDADNFALFGCTDQQVEAAGDSRFDRVYEKSIAAKELNLLRNDIVKEKKVFVAGSIWSEDEEVILPAIKKIIRYDDSSLFILVPHEPALVHLEKLEHDFNNTAAVIRFSHLNRYNNERIIIVDSIGILLSLYRYADAAFVGGSFKSNVHNVLEAAVYGIPVLFGPKIENSQEAAELLESGGGIMINNKKEAYKEIRSLLLDNHKRESLGSKSKQYVIANIGAAEKITKVIETLLRKHT